MKHQSESGGINRRQFLSQSGITLLGASMPGIITDPLKGSEDNNQKEQATYPGFHSDGWKNKLHEAVKYRKLDAHNHINNLNAKEVNESCRRLGITKTAISVINGRNADEIRQNNDIVLDAMKEFPNRIIGQCFINPGFKGALEEIDRCIDKGMVMLGELYDAYKVNDPIYYPIIEKCIKLKIPLLWHATASLGNWRKGFQPAARPNASIAEDFIDVGRRYPEAMIIHAHIGGGGNWEYICRVLKDIPSIYLDTSGSVTDQGIIDMGVKYLGVDRLLFATDDNYETGVGKIMAANLTESDRKKIFFDNFNNLLRKAGNHVD
jgi:predicted TIM-barrel fold metal-dependent hydrolase